MNILKCVPTLLVVVTACGGAPEGDLSGSWNACLEADSRVVCGSVEVAANRGPEASHAAWYPFTFDLALDSLPSLSRPPAVECGSFLVDAESWVQVHFAIDCGSVMVADGRNVITDFMQLRGDSLIGEWTQSCYSGCTTGGAVILVRERR